MCVLGQFANMQDFQQQKKVMLYDEICRRTKGLSIAFDLLTHRGYMIQTANALGDVGKQELLLTLVEDMESIV
jgi:methylmalonyl-CoA mutase N-terminal domain/subunit